MYGTAIERHFAKIGARAKIYPERRWHDHPVTIDIGRDDEGEFFDIAVAPSRLADLRILDTQPQVRHLLLLAGDGRQKSKFLCGHDERHWFVAAVPERAPVSSVSTAFDALKPFAVRLREERLRVKPSRRNRRRNEAFVRQGEWFFVPAPPTVRIDPRRILRNEPISRGRGKPHWCEQLVREGGELVYVCPQFPQGLTERQYRQRIDRDSTIRHLPWVAQRRNPTVFVCGKVRHADHKTIVLPGWHQVLMNTENQSLALGQVLFID